MDNLSRGPGDPEVHYYVGAKRGGVFERLPHTRTSAREIAEVRVEKAQQDFPDATCQFVLVKGTETFEEVDD